MAQRSVEAAELDTIAARLALAGVLTQTYIDLARACALRDLAAATVKQRASILELTNTRVRNGLESTTAQKNAEALLALARADRIRADSALELTRHQIAALIGRGADVYTTIQEPTLNRTRSAATGPPGRSAGAARPYRPRARESIPRFPVATWRARPSIPTSTSRHLRDGHRSASIICSARPRGPTARGRRSICLF
ncbi:MAG: TolC family protein [Gammaproteobacteria bacterium]|nr:TolC family protein [Gammaproteobacteria bacterium]